MRLSPPSIQATDKRFFTLNQESSKLPNRLVLALPPMSDMPEKKIFTRNVGFSNTLGPILTIFELKRNMTPLQWVIGCQITTFRTSKIQDRLTNESNMIPIWWLIGCQITTFCKLKLKDRSSKNFVGKKLERIWDGKKLE